ncbi:MAG: class I SAM-dependent methyltransferase [Phycisphaerales bacterium]|nr:class I SAM-dependent methyltransferase [Phycisphaerales bacterium]
MICRLCGGHAFAAVCDLGPMPLVNNLLHHPADACQRWPLVVCRCTGCGLVQLTESVPPPLMFDDYCYFSSQSATMVEHARGLVAAAVAPGDAVVEIASNDGYLLRSAIERGARVLGVDPARNVAAEAERRGVPTLCAYFDAATAASIRRDFGAADVLFACNVLAHVPDPHAIAAGIKTLLAPEGRAHVEVPSLERMIETVAFDTIYHEHQCYFALAPLRRLFAHHDLRIVAVRAVPVHGGSLHVEVAHDGDESAAEAWCRREAAAGLEDDPFYRSFATRIDDLRDAVRGAVADAGSVGAYGAAAKGVVLLNAFDLRGDAVAWVADVSPHKQGRFIPGTGQPVVAPDHLRTASPAACLLLAWNLESEVRRQEAAYLAAGGSLLIPRPDRLRTPVAG